MLSLCWLQGLLVYNGLQEDQVCAAASGSAAKETGSERSICILSLYSSDWSR